MEYLPIRLESGDIIHVEVTESPATAERAVRAPSPSRGTAMGPSVAEKADRHFGEAVRVVKTVAAQVTEGLLAQDSPARRLSEVSMELQIGFDVKGGVFIAQGGASASLKLNLKWTLPPPPAAPTP